MRPVVAALALAALVFIVAGCATLQALGPIVQPPRFTAASDHTPEIHLLGPSSDLPAGGASIRLWTNVTNPNPFGFTLSSLSVTLKLENTQAATGNFPLGLPLQAGQQSTVPIDLTVSFSDLPGLASVLRNALSSNGVPYTVDGTVGIDAGALGQPTFGPMTLFTGELRR